MKPLIVTGTDTDVGKTIAAAMLTLALDGVYWKPIQSGVADGTDTKTVAALTGLDSSHFHPERYVFRQPLSPHRAAELDGVAIDIGTFDLPRDLDENQWLIVEGAGGVMVPVTRTTLQIDLFAHWNAPIVLCARTALGTINHSLLSIEALRLRDLNLLGILFIGDENKDSERTIVEFGGIKRLGRLPMLPTLDRRALLAAFDAGFDRGDFEAAYGG